MLNSVAKPRKLTVAPPNGVHTLQPLPPKYPATMQAAYAIDTPTRESGFIATTNGGRTSMYMKWNHGSSGPPIRPRCRVDSKQIAAPEMSPASTAIRRDGANV